MASIKQDILRGNRELKPLLDIYEPYAYRYGYYKVFEDFIDYCVAQYSPFEEYKLPDYVKQPDKDRHDFVKMLDVIIGESKKRCSLWIGDRSRHGWYDPFGAFFETVASEFGKSYKGQFFTPEPLCNMMAQMIVSEPSEKIGETMCEPACGSGRLTLAANAVNPTMYCVSNDIDSLCAKMCAINYCLNGVVGEISCNDGLWATESNFRFAYKCVPLAYTKYGDSGFFKAWAFMSESIRKQYILIPLKFEDCSYNMNCHFEEIIKTEKERREEVAPHGMQGILFEVEQAKHRKNGLTKKEQKTNKETTPQPILSPTLF